MAEPLKVILVVAAVCSGLYGVMFVKNVVLTGQVNPVYLLQMVGAFAGVLGIGLLIWGVVAVCRAAARKTGSNKAKTRHLQV